MGRPAKRTYSNILINQLNNIGDVLLATSGVALLKKAYPEAKITMMVVPRVAELLQNHPLVDEVITFEYKSKQTSRREMLDIIKLVRSKKFDLNISFDYRLRPLLIAWLSGIPERVSGDYLYQSHPVWHRVLFTHRIPLRGQFTHCQQGEMFRQVVQELTGIKETLKPVMPNPHQDSEALVASLVGAEKENKIVLYCVRGTHEGKNWPAEHFAVVMKSLQERTPSLRQYVIGAPGDFPYAENVIGQSGVAVGNLCGKTRLADLPVLFERASLFITVDTGAMHIAATTPVPILALFLNTNCIQWGPDSEQATVLVRTSILEQFNISAADCPNCVFVQEISCQDVIEQVNKVLVE